MRRLYLVPVLHMGADMGSLSSMLEETAIARVGEMKWRKHRETVAAFWNCIAQFFEALDVRGLKVYQDGMVAEGEDGLRIVREGISQGSRNYEIIGKLLERGAVLVRTEDPALVKQEYVHLTRIARSRSPKEKEVWTLRYKLAQDRLLRERDDYVARRIDETLCQDEVGILFIGAYHDVLSRLREDIQVVQVKDVSEVRQHHQALLAIARDTHIDESGDHQQSPSGRLAAILTTDSSCRTGEDVAEDCGSRRDGTPIHLQAGHSSGQAAPPTRGFRSRRSGFAPPNSGTS